MLGKINSIFLFDLFSQSINIGCSPYFCYNISMVDFMKHICQKLKWEYYSSKIFKLSFLFAILLVAFAYNGFLNSEANTPQGVIERKTKIDLIKPIEEELPKSAALSSSPIVGNNVTQFDVGEAIFSQSIQHETQPRFENITHGVPLGWNFAAGNIQLGGVYDEKETFEIQNITQINPNLTTDMYPKYSLIGTPSFYFSTTQNVLGRQQLEINTTLTSQTVVNPHAFAYWAERNNQKPFSSFEPIETYKVRDENQEILFYDAFWDPGVRALYTKNDGPSCPYGGSLEWATAEAFIYQDYALGLRIKAGGSSARIGNPSLNWARFGVIFDKQPQRVDFYLTWAKENRGYELADTYRMIGRFDENYMDGRNDSYGNFYPNASVNSLVLDNTVQSTFSHLWISRSWDITRFINFSRIIHTLDFGIWLQTMDDTEDEVRTYFLEAALVVTEYDQYFIGTMGFTLELFTSSNNPQAFESFGLYYYVVSDTLVGNNVTKNYYLQYLGQLSDIYQEMQNQGNYKRYITTELTSTAKRAFNGTNIVVHFVIYSLWTHVQVYPFSVAFDDLSTKIQYGTNNYSMVGLQHWNTTQWVNITTPILYTENPAYSNGVDVQFQFRFSNNTFQNYFLYFTAYLGFVRFVSNGAWASYYIPSFSRATEVKWELYFNTSSAINLIDDNIENFDYWDYFFEIVNIPAFDNKGNASQDWNIVGAWSPIPFGASERINISSQIVRKSNSPNVGMNQSLRVYVGSILNQENGIYLNGTYIINVTTPNYLQRASALNGTYGTSEVFFNGDTLRYVANLSNLGYPISNGNYNITIANPNDVYPSGFPLYVSNHAGNYSGTWIVVDSGIGTYELLAVWNDTSIVSSGKTYRVGYSYDTFGVYRHTNANLTGTPSGPVPSGTLAFYTMNYSDSNWVGLLGAEIIVKNNATGNLWGYDFGPGSYLVNPIAPSLDGNYTVQVRTEYVPQSTYTLRFELSKPFYETKILYATLIITGSQMIIEFNYGIVNSSNNLSLATNNIPFVNDSFSSYIIVNVTNSSIAREPIRDGFISGQFNFSGASVFSGVELFSQTQNESDKGRYILYLNTTGCNETYSNVYRYNLTLFFSASGFETQSYNINAPIKPLPTSLEVQNIESIYEGGSTELFAFYRNILNPMNPIPITNGNLSWYISNGTIIRSGQLTHLIGGTYKLLLDLSQTPYVYPGIYNLTINATAINCQNASYIISLTVLSKISSNMTLTVSSEVRIGKYMDININLTRIGGIPIPFADILLDITFGANPSTQVIRTTAANGGATYSLFVDFIYANVNVTVIAAYAGNGTIHGTTRNQTRTVQGKYNVTIIYSELPSSVRVGYSLTVKAKLTIPGVEVYTNYLLSITGTYDDNGTSQYSFIERLNCNQTGWVEYFISEIADSHENLSIAMEYGGSYTENYLMNKTYLVVIPKWKTAMSVQGISGSLRIGQKLNISVAVQFNETGATEILKGMPVQLKITRKSGSILETFTSFVSESNTTNFIYNIPDDSGTEANIEIRFSGNNKIESKVFTYDAALLAKLRTSVKLLQEKSVQNFAGDFYYSALLTDEEGNPVAGKSLMFLVKNQAGTIVKNQSAVTNEQGIASVSLNLEELGTFTVEALYESDDFYASGSSTEYGYNYVRVVDYMTLIIDNISTILLAIGILITSAIAINRLYVVPKRNRRLEALKAIHQQLSDVQNIQYMMIIHKERGLPMFSHAFSDVPIEETLISGFLSAISSFGSELGQSVKSDKKGMFLDELSYQQFRISMYEGKNVRTALLLLKPASRTLKEKMTAFNRAVETQFGEEISKWTGKQLKPNAVIEIIEQVLKADLLYYHNVVEKRVAEVKKVYGRKSLQYRILEEGAKEYNNRFRIPDMLNHMSGLDFKEVNTFNAIAELRDQKVLFAINPRTQLLIDQFKPIIASLSPSGRMLMKQISQGETNLQKLIKANKGVDVNKELETLKAMQMVTDEPKLTDTGEVMLTLIELMPEL